MLSRALAAGFGSTLFLVVADPAAAVAKDDDDDISVSPGWAGWIDTEVTDLGPLARVAAPRLASMRPVRTCVQSKSEEAGGYASEEQFASGAPPSAGPGGWVIRRCSDGTLETAWVPAVPVGPETPQRLAQRAVNRLRLPLPEPSFEPRRLSSAGPATLVAIPTSFYLRGWAPVSQRTQAGAVWAVVSVEPVAATWWPGDGSAPVRCSGAGRPWSAGSGTQPRCTHTYVRSSAAQPDNVYTGRVTVTWRVTWRGSGGRTGSLPLMERQSTFPVAVAERQTVVVGGGSS